jgi:hypothetical protein
VSLYDEAIYVAKSYLGPAADRFMTRQLSALNIEPGLLGPQHLEALGGRCYTSGKLLMDDAKAKEFENRVKGLG